MCSCSRLRVNVDVCEFIFSQVCVISFKFVCSCSRVCVKALTCVFCYDLAVVFRFVPCVPDCVFRSDLCIGMFGFVCSISR